MPDATTAFSRLQELVDLGLAERSIIFRTKIRAVTEECASRGVALGGPLIWAISERAFEEAEERSRLIVDTIVESITRTTFEVSENQIMDLFDSARYDDCDLLGAVEDAFKISGLQRNNEALSAARSRFEKKRRSARAELAVFAMSPRRADTQISVYNPNFVQTGGLSNVHQYSAAANGNGTSAEGIRIELVSRLKTLRKIVAGLDDPRAGIKWWIDPAKSFIEKIDHLPIGSALTADECDAVHEVEMDVQLGMDQMRIEDELQQDKVAAGWQPDGSLVVSYFSQSDADRTRMRACHFRATLKDIDLALSLLSAER